MDKLIGREEPEQPPILNTFQANTPVRADQMNENFFSLKEEILSLQAEIAKLHEEVVELRYQLQEKERQPKWPFS